MSRTLGILVLAIAGCSAPPRAGEVEPPPAVNAEATQCDAVGDRCIDCTPPPMATVTRDAGWSGLCGLRTARVDHAAVLLLDGKLLVIGGETVNAQLEASTEMYDPETGAWSAGPEMDRGRAGHAAVVLDDGRVLVTGGEDEGTAELFLPDELRWVTIAPMAMPRSRHTMTKLADGRVLVVGGDREPVSGAFDLLEVAEVFDPATGSWLPAGGIESRTRHTATLLLDGRVLVSGGDGPNGSLSSTAIFDPADLSWTASLPMDFERRDHAASLLGDGQVLVTGGVRGLSCLQTTEIWDPAGGEWTPAPPMQQPRAGHTATVLGDGRVLVLGGEPTAKLEPVAEAYSLTREAWEPLGSPRRWRTDHAVVSYDRGIVVVLGGRSQLPGMFVGEPSSSVEVLTVWRP